MEEKSFTLTVEDYSRESLWFAMGYKGGVPDENIRVMAEEIIRRLIPVARVRYMYRIVPAERINPRQMVVDGTLFTPNGIICSYLDGMTHACIYVTTAGLEFDAAVKELCKEGDIVADFIADSIGTTLAELAVEKLEQELSPRPGVSKSYSPGYCGWDIREQHLFFPLFPEKPCGITLTESSLMSPEKSISGFFAMGDHLQKQPYHCEICKNTKCYKRRNA